MMFHKINEICGEGQTILELFEGAVHADPIIKIDENRLKNILVFATCKIYPSQNI